MVGDHICEIYGVDLAGNSYLLTIHVRIVPSLPILIPTSMSLLGILGVVLVIPIRRQRALKRSQTPDPDIYEQMYNIL